jgi:hypothetical protein
MVSSHPDVHTLSEPWVMLHPIYPLQDTSGQFEYNYKTYQEALLNFLDNISGGEKSYIEGVRKMYGYLYEKALTDKKAKFFLDKTPRYYLIFRKLHDVFPEARYLLLLRHPLAVLSSLLRKKPGRGLEEIKENRVDLVKAPDLIMQILEDNNRGKKIVRYENLVTEPKKEVRKICSYLSIEMKSEMINYGGNEEVKWSLGDQKKVYERSRPSDESIKKWVSVASNDAQYWRLMSEYLEFLGPDKMSRLGYSYDEAREELDTVKHSSAPLRSTVSLDRVLSESERKSKFDRTVIRLAENYQEGGLSLVARRAFHRIRQRAAGVWRS